MNYLKANIKKFSIAEYFEHINAQFRETVEKDFKRLIGKIGNFENNAKNLPLLQFASRLRSTKFEILFSEESDEYWSNVLASTIERKRIYAHLASEATIADAILNNAKKRWKSKVLIAEKEKILSDCQQSVSSSVTEKNIWEAWSEIISYLNCCDDSTINLNEYSLEHLGIVQLGDKIGNNTTRKLFANSLVASSNDIIRTAQKNIFESHKDFYEDIFIALESSLEGCEELLLRNCLKVRKTKDICLTFCYESLLIFVQQVFILGGLGNIEAVYNFRLIWRMLDTVAKSQKGHRFVPGEVCLNAIKNELAHRELSLSSCFEYKRIGKRKQKRQVCESSI